MTIFTIATIILTLIYSKNETKLSLPSIQTSPVFHIDNSTTITGIMTNTTPNNSRANSSMYFNSSSNINVNNSSASPRILVSFINGIYHSAEDWLRITLNLTQLFGATVRGFYNPSSGYWISDATKAGYELIRSPVNAQSAQRLAEHFRTMFREMGPRDRILHLAHSGGAIVTYLCAKYHLTRAETDRIDVTTLGGGRSITRKYFHGRIVNYYARNDPLVLVDKRAGRLVRLAAQSDYSEVMYAKHNTSFVFLEGRANNPILDHSMEGVTYLTALQREAVWRRRSEYLLSLELAPTHVIWGRGLRKLAANITGYHHFWNDTLAVVRRVSSVNSSVNSSRSSYYPSLDVMRAFRKASARITGRRGFYSGKHTSKREELALIVASNERYSVQL